MQIFHSRANAFAKAIIIGFVLLIALILVIAFYLVRSSYVNKVDVAVEQPVQFTHAHHVSGLGIDCRYCHTSVTQSAYAGIPPTHTCMTCHSQIWTEAPILEPVRQSFETGMPIEWNRVHNLGDFVYFNHSIHVDQGVGCVTCHGQVDQMPLIWKAEPLTMEWCLNCHFEPEQYLRPREEVFNMQYQPPADQLALGRRLIDEYNINLEVLTNCSTCHR